MSRIRDELQGPPATLIWAGDLGPFTDLSFSPMQCECPLWLPQGAHVRMKEKAPMKAHVKCEASGSLAVRVLLCSSVSFPFSHICPSPQVQLKWAGRVQGPGTPGAAGCHSKNQAGARACSSPGALMTLPWETEAECLRSICHYGNKVARPFFLLLFFLKRAEGLLLMNNSVYDSSITLIPKPDKVIARKANKCLSWPQLQNFP